MRHLLPLLPALLLLSGCPTEPEPEPEPEPTFEVTPLYEGAGAWNDRVLDDGDDPLDASGAACPCGPEAGDCIQAGPLRALALPQLDDCDGVEATDSLGALEWICREDSQPVRVVSDGLAEDAGLATLVDAEAVAWRSAQLIVTVDGEELLRTDEAVWWTDPVEALPLTEGVITLDAAGTVYTLAAPRESGGVQIAADSVSLVTGEAAPLSWNGLDAPSCNGQTGEVEGADTTCLVAAGGQSCLWLEGRYLATGAERSVFLSDVHASTVWRAEVVEGGDGLTLGQGSSGNLVFESRIQAATGDGLVLTEGATGNLVRELLVEGAAFTAVNLWGSDANTLRRVTAEYSGWGFYLEDSHDNLLLDVVAHFNDQEGYFLWDASGNVLDDAASWWNGWSGFYVATGSDDTRLIDVGSKGDGAAGIVIEDVAGTDVFGAVVADADQAGVATWGSFNTTLLGIAVSNNAYDGLYGDNTVDMTAIDVLANNNDEDGVHFSDGTEGLTLLNVTAVDNGDDGLELHNTAGGQFGAVLANAVSANNAGDGLDLDDSFGVVVADLAVFANGENGIEIEGMDDLVFTGLLRVGASGGLDCFVNDDVGLEHETCLNVGGSDAALELDLDLTEAFTGPLVADDIVNDDDFGGACDPEDLTDWLDFESRYRSWGIEGDWPGADVIGICGDGDVCHVRDWRVNTDSPILKNIHGEGDHDVPCPDSVHGDVVLTDFQEAPNTFLRHAVEVVLDEVGDEDGLCEEGETCTYAPNQGAYQGEGSPTACNFVGGILSDVEVLVFHANGAT